MEGKQANLMARAYQENKPAATYFICICIFVCISICICNRCGWLLRAPNPWPNPIFKQREKLG